MDNQNQLPKQPSLKELLLKAELNFEDEPKVEDEVQSERSFTAD